MHNDFKLTQEDIQALIEHAGMAPSGGNVQPWKVFVSGNDFDIKLEPSRSNSFLDIGYYASLFAMGAFTENLCITADALGLEYTIAFPTFVDVSSSLVKITFIGKKGKKDAEQKSLFDVIPQRVTNRHLSDGTTLDPEIIHTLLHVAKTYNQKYTVHALYELDKKEELVNLLGKLDGIRTLNEACFKQMLDEFRWTKEETEQTRDGMDLATLEMPENAKKGLELIKRFPNMRFVLPKKVFEDNIKPVLMASSHLCCLTYEGELTPEAMFFSGRSFERLWLKATSLGVSLQPWSIMSFFLFRVNYFNGVGFSQDEIKEIKKQEERLQNVFGLSAEEVPLFIFRLSKTRKRPSARSLRLPWTSYTTIVS